MPAHFVIRNTVSDSELAAILAPKVDNLGRAMARRAQRAVPKRTFALHDTIDSQTTTSGPIIRTTLSAGSGDVDYWYYVEKGTSRMAAQPYLRPALLQSRSVDLNDGGPGASRHGVRTYRPRAKSRGASARRSRS